MIWVEYTHLLYPLCQVLGTWLPLLNLDSWSIISIASLRGDGTAARLFSFAFVFITQLAAVGRKPQFRKLSRLWHSFTSMLDKQNYLEKTIKLGR